MKTYIITLLIAGSALPLSAQTLLTLEEAVATAMENNPDIQVKRLDAEIADNNVHRGNAGQLPTVGVQGSYDYNYLIDQRIELGDINFGLPPGEDPGDAGDGTESPDAGLGGAGLVTETIGGSLTANYVLFNGFQGRYRYQQLQVQDSLAQRQLVGTMEAVFVDVLRAYLEVAQHQRQLSVYEETITQSQERLERNRIANDYGGANQLQTLQAEVDLNNDSVAYQDQRLAYRQAKQQLALLMERPVDQDFVVEEDITSPDEPLEYSTLRADLQRANTNLQVAQYNLQIVEKNKALEDASRFPTISAVAGFSYNYQAAEQSITELQESYGPVVGLRLDYSLYDGHQRKIRRQNARLAVQQQQVVLRQTRRQLETELLTAYQDYENYRRQLTTERANLATYERNLQKAQSTYELGITSGTELRDAQLNLMNAQNRIIGLEFSVKRAETQLLRLSGGLIVFS